MTADAELERARAEKDLPMDLDFFTDSEADVSVSPPAKGSDSDGKRPQAASEAILGSDSDDDNIMVASDLDNTNSIMQDSDSDREGLMVDSDIDNIGPDNINNIDHHYAPHNIGHDAMDFSLGTSPEKLSKEFGTDFNTLVLPEDVHLHLDSKAQDVVEKAVSTCFPADSAEQAKVGLGPKPTEQSH